MSMPRRGKIRCKTVFTSVTLNFTVIRTQIFNGFHADQVPHLEIQIKHRIQEGHSGTIKEKYDFFMF
jgi:hypothetical protein